MTDYLLQDVRQFRDNLGVWFYQLETESLGTPPQEAVQRAARLGRDKTRTPMQWSDAPNAGFSPAGVQTWLPVNPNYAQGLNVASQVADRDSLLDFYRRLLHARRRTPALFAGDYMPLHEDAQDYLAFLRRLEGGKTCLVVLNMSDRAHTLRFDLQADIARLIFSSQVRESEWHDVRRLRIAPFEVYIAELKRET